MDPTQCEEEQALEAESLECILMDDLEVLSASVPRQYRVRVVPYVNGEGENYVAVKATFSIPPGYPDTKADVSVAAVKGLSTSQCQELERLMDQKATENEGMAMVYLLVDMIREWLIERNVAGATDGSMHAEMLKRMHMKEKDEKRAADTRAGEVASSASLSEEDALMRQKRLEGTPVTPESFLKWRTAFEAEMAACAEAKGGVGVAGKTGKAAGNGGAVKPSGKEMFLRHLAGTAEEDEEGAEEDEGGRLEVESELFEEEEDDSDFELESEDDEDESDYGDDSEESEESDAAATRKKGREKKGGDGLRGKKR
ncbi:Ubiquitin-conjugating enzyme/RWD [Nannochloropsis gaditana]|uniref:Ubiquitin-conjugating enzyme/RWD n=1 Tax=Nannochloropsis gaditana TaxID=72520 RepID=W7TMA0_9STRA|nr:Ubiquitin-conjugating enzyme/RWD [Nannochloropsis gaditana]